MKCLTIVVFCLTAFKLSSESSISSPKDDPITDESRAEEYLCDVNTNLAKEMNKIVTAEWTFNTNINNETSNNNLAAQKEFSEFQKKQWTETMKFDWTNFKNEDTKRQFDKLALLGISALEEQDFQTYSKISSEMQQTYSTAKVSLTSMNQSCGEQCELEPDLTNILANSNDSSLLQDVWVKWRDETGAPIREKYIQYYTLGNKAATLNKIPGKDLKTLDDIWLYPWETPDIKDQVEKLWDQLKPLYEKLHAYVRFKLTKLYPGIMPDDRTIPAHLLGNMWAQSWSNILKFGVDPYPEINTIDVTDAMVNQGYNAKRMFELSDKFFGDLSLENMTEKFWQKSVLTKPPNVEMICHASAWDFYADDEGKDDFRIKQCTDVTMNDLITVHHEMGHIEYFMQYKDQRVVYRDGANPGFHEAIGDLLALSVSTPKHLHKIELLDNLPTDAEEIKKLTIKYQLKMALDKLAFLPFGYIMDLWRWDVFSGKTPKEQLNRHWWELRLKYQGVSPPIRRSERDFDPGSKYHIPASVEYIRYFVSHILQFQFHEKLCSIAEPSLPLHECDIDNNKEAGNELAKMLKKGSSEPWTKQLQEFVGTDKMNVSSLLKYFEPLENFLDETIKEENIPVGWDYKIDDYFEKEGTDEGGSGTCSKVCTSLFVIIILFAFLKNSLI